MSRRIAFFDFDGTITKKDTLLEFIRYYKGNYKFYFGFLLKSPFILAYKLGILKNFVAKRKVLQFFFNGESVDIFNNRCKDFSEQILTSLIRPKAFREIEILKQSGATVAVVSASAENWIQYWCNKYQIDFIGTKLDTVDGKITGNLEGSNCYGNEKAIRIKLKYNLSDYDEIFCYGDSAGDKEMLELGTFRFYKPFR
jgi:HAD superfamily hydrolase (TIGR01490 family)